MTTYGLQADVNANQGRNVLLYVPGQTKLTSNDIFLGGTGTGVGDDQLNGAQRVAGMTAQDTANAYGSMLNPDNNLKYNSNQDMANIQSTALQLKQSSIDQSKAMLQSALQSQVTQLSMAYDQAIADGKISIRDAQDAFTAQKAQIEAQAYQDAERTALYSQDMGIQNSQQALGLQASDNSRTNSLINTNMTTRDKQISDIKDRLTSLKNQQSLSLVQANNEYNTGLATATANANNQYAQTLLGLQTDDMNAKRAQQYALDNLMYQQQYNKDNMAIQQGYNVDNMNTQHTFDLETLDINNKNDMAKIQKQFENEVTMAGIQYGYQSKLQSQSDSAAMSRAKASLASNLKSQQDQYEVAKQRELAKYTPGTDEYNIAQKQLDSANSQAKQQIYSKAIAEADMAIYAKGEPIAPTISAWDKMWGTDKDEQYAKDKAAYDAIKRKIEGQ